MLMFGIVFFCRGFLLWLFAFSLLALRLLLLLSIFLRGCFGTIRSMRRLPRLRLLGCLGGLVCFCLRGFCLLLGSSVRLLVRGLFLL